jgi:hypothetical protein
VAIRGQAAARGGVSLEIMANRAHASAQPSGTPDADRRTFNAGMIVIIIRCGKIKR